MSSMRVMLTAMNSRGVAAADAVMLDLTVDGRPRAGRGCSGYVDYSSTRNRSGLTVLDIATSNGH
jgi:hypothetical protein